MLYKKVVFFWGRVSSETVKIGTGIGSLNAFGRASRSVSHMLETGLLSVLFRMTERKLSEKNRAGPIHFKDRIRTLLFLTTKLEEHRPPEYQFTLGSLNVLGSAHSKSAAVRQTATRVLRKEKVAE